MGESFSLVAAKASRRDLEKAIFQVRPTLEKKGETVPGLTPAKYEELCETIVLERSEARMSGRVDERACFGIYQDGDWAVYFGDEAGLLVGDPTVLEALSRIVGPLVCVVTETHAGYYAYQYFENGKIARQILCDGSGDGETAVLGTARPEERGVDIENFSDEEAWEIWAAHGLRSPYDLDIEFDTIVVESRESVALALASLEADKKKKERRGFDKWMIGTTVLLAARAALDDFEQALFDSWPTWKRLAPPRTLADQSACKKFLKDTTALGECFAAYQDGPWSVQWAGGHYGELENLCALSRRVGTLVCIAVNTRSAYSALYQYFEGGELRREIERVVREVVEKGAPRPEEAGISLTKFERNNGGFAWPIWLAHGLSYPQLAKNLRGYVFEETAAPLTD